MVERMYPEEFIRRYHSKTSQGMNQNTSGIATSNEKALLYITAFALGVLIGVVLGVVLR